MDAWTYDKIDEAVQILADIADSLKRLADFYTPIPSKDEPQKHCHRPNNVACHPEQGDMWCRGCDYWYANEPQAERSE